MPFVYIVLSFATLILFILAQDVYVRIYYDEEFEVSFNFVLLAFALSKDKDPKKPKAKQKKRKRRLGSEFYFLLLRHISGYAEYCEVTVNRLKIPRISFGRGTLLLPSHDFGWSASLLIAYLDSKATKLTLRDNALILDPDTGTAIDLYFKSTYFNMLKFMIRLWLEYKNHVGKRDKNVGK